MVDEMPTAIIETAYEMLQVGAAELEKYDSETENPLEAVARIYMAMELMRILKEDGDMLPRGEKLN